MVHGVGGDAGGDAGTPHVCLDPIPSSATVTVSDGFCDTVDGVAAGI